jgi:hypothetical protein
MMARAYGNLQDGAEIAEFARRALRRSIGRGTLHAIDDPHFHRRARGFELQAHLLLERREDSSSHK